MRLSATSARVTGHGQPSLIQRAIRILTDGTQGWWYDPSDFTKYMVTGPELAGLSTEWTAYSGNVSLSGGQMVFSAAETNSYALRGIALVVGARYTLEIKVDSISGGALQMLVGGGQGTVTISAPGTYRTTVQALGVDGPYIWVVSGTVTAVVSVASCKELTGLSACTLFQDAAGTTPVTAVEQQVGLMLDKSKGLILGPELCTDSTVSNTSAWNVFGAGSNPWTANTGALVCSASSSGNRWVSLVGLSLTVGKTYRVECDCTITAGGFLPDISATPVYRTTSGRASWTLTASGTAFQFIATATFVGSVDNISVRELPGNNATQATSTSRPILRNRYNLLTKTEDFTDTSVWTTVVAGSGVAPVRVANDTVDPDEVLTADKLTFNAPVSGDQSMVSQIVSSLVAGASYVLRVPVKAATLADVGKTIVYRPFAAAGFSTLTLTSEYQQIYLQASPAATTEVVAFGLRPAVGGSSGTVSIHIAKASLVKAADATLPYQRVNTATDYDSDTSKFPLYLDADGSDDGMATAAFAAGSDKVTVFAAVHKATDSLDQQTIMEFGADSGSTVGTFAIQSSPALAPQIRFQLYGSSRGVRDTQSEFAAPRTMVISCAYDISGSTVVDEVKPRINGATPALYNTLTPSGTGNFGTHALNLFRRNATNLPFQGRFYGAAGKFRTLSASEITTVEQYLRMKSRAY